MAIKVVLKFIRPSPGPFWEKTPAQDEYIETNYVQTGKILEISTVVTEGTPTVKEVTTIYLNEESQLEFLSDPVIDSLRTERDAACIAMGIEREVYQEEV